MQTTTYFLNISFSPCLSLVGNPGHPTRVRRRSHKSSATYSYQCVQYSSMSKQWYGCQHLGFVMCAQMLTHVIAHGGCMDTVRESAPEVDTGRKIYCHTWYSKPHQYCTWLFSPMLYQLSRPRPLLMLTTQMLALLRALRLLFVCVCDQRSRPSEAEQRDARGLGPGSLQQLPPCLRSGVRCVLGTDGGFLV